MKNKKIITTVLSLVLVAATIIGTMMPVYAIGSETNGVTATNTPSDTVNTPSDTVNTPSDTAPGSGDSGSSDATPSTPSVHTHYWNLALQSDATTHYYVCFDCGAKDEVTAHTFNTAGNCTVCGYHNAEAVISPVATPVPEATEKPADEPVVEDIVIEVAEPETENAYSATIDTENLAEAVLTEDELALAANGEEVVIVLEVADISETVSEEDKQLVEAALDENTVALYLDINLFKQIGSNDAVQVTETASKVKVEVVLPESLINNDTNVNREYKVIRVHNGETTVLDAEFDISTGKLVFETDAFSTYSVVYKDTAVQSPVADTQEPAKSNSGSMMPLFIAAAVVVVAAAVVISKKKKA